MFSFRSESGFVALTATIIVAAVLLVLVVTVASKSFYGRFNIIDAEVKEASRALAEACVQTVRLEIAKDSDYAGEEVVQIGDQSCYICDINPTHDPRVVLTRASSSDAYTNLRVEIEGSDPFAVESWEEIPRIDISGGTCTTP